MLKALKNLFAPLPRYRTVHQHEEVGEDGRAIQCIGSCRMEPTFYGRLRGAR